MVIRTLVYRKEKPSFEELAKTKPCIKSQDHETGWPNYCRCAKCDPPDVFHGVFSIGVRL